MLSLASLASHQSSLFHINDMTPTPSAPSSLDVDIPRPSPRACDTCRRKHLKCDAVAPVCGRCAAESLTCQYTPSRRGMGRRIHRRRPSRPPSCDRSVEATNTNTCMANRQLGASLLTPPESFFGQLAPLTDLTVTPMQQQGQRQEQHQQREQQQREKQQEQQQQEQQQQQQQRYPLPPLSDLLATTPAATSTATATAAATATTATTAPWSLRDADRDRLLGLFYSKFFPVHPFLVPKPFYAAQHYPRFLDLTICFVGLHYAKPPPDDGSILREAVSAVMAENDAHTAHRVQALVLYAIVLHSCQQQKEAASCVGRAAAIAISLGMHDPAFAQANAHQSPLVEESLRRTWWELYTVDVYLAAVNRRSTYETVSARPYPLLPCAQKVYELGQCGLDHPLTLRAFEDRVFSRDLNLSFPSISYRIEAVRIVGRVLSLATTDDATPDSIQALDNALASWKHNLPACKIDMVDSSGEVDLMLFQACCFISCASIFLHFPRSDLPATIPSASDIACARGYTQLAPTSGHHTIKAIAASKELSNLASIPLPLENHSPFFICGLILGCVVQLAVGIIHLHKCGLDCLQEHRDRVVLMLGTLQRMGETWTLAQNAVHCLKIVAENLFSPRTPTDEAATSPSFASNEVDVGQVFNNTAWFDLFTADDIQGNFFNI